MFLFLSTCMPGEQNLPSPDTIAQYIHDKDYVALEKALQQLEMDSPQSLLDFIIEGDSSSGERTSVERTSVEVNGHSEYSLLLIKANYWRKYLVFRSDEEKWKFLGEIDETNYHQDTTHRMITDNQGNVWLVIRSVVGYGTDVFCYGESWYSLNGKKVEEALNYIVYGV